MKNVEYLLTILIFCLFMGASQAGFAQEKADTLKKNDTLVHMDGFEHSNIAVGMTAFRQEVATLYRIPRKAYTSKIQGKLEATFVIDKEGKMINIELTKDLGFGTGDELVRVLTQLAKKHTWTPARKDGEPVLVQYSIPLSISY